MSTNRTSMSDDELELLGTIGQYLMQDVVSLICETIWWAGYGALFVFAVYIQIQKGLKARSSKLMLCTTLLLFGSSTTLWGLKAALTLLRIRARLVDNPTWPLDERYDYSVTLVYSFGTPMEALFLLNLLVGDAIVLWRASVLWTGTRKVLILPAMFLIGSFVFAVMAVFCIAQDGYGTKSAIPSGGRVCNWSEPIAWAMSLFTNLLSTSLIAWKAWAHRHFLRKNFLNRPKRTQAEKMLMLLIESGFLYCAFWILQVVDFIDIPRSSPAFHVYSVISTMGDQISGLYPTVIIVLVALQQTVADATAHIHGYTGSTTRTATLQFANSGTTAESGVFSDGVHMQGSIQMGKLLSSKANQSLSVDRESDFAGDIVKSAGRV